MKKYYLFPFFIIILILSGFVYKNNAPQSELGWVKSVAFSPDGKFLLTGGQDKILKIWNRESGRLVKSITAKQSGACEISDIDFTSDGKLFAYNEQYKVIVSNFESKEQIFILDGHDFSAVNVIKFTPDGKYLVSGSFDKTAKLWDLTTGKIVKTFKNGEQVFTVNISNDGKLLATGGAGNFAKVWDLNTGKLLKTFKMPEKIYQVTSVQFSQDDKSLLVASERGLILWDLETGTETKRYMSGSNGPLRALFNKEYTQIIYADMYGLVVLDAVSGEKIARISCHNGKRITSLAISADGNFVATGSLDNSSIIFDLRDKSEVGKFIHSKSDNEVRDFKLIGSDKGVTIYGAESFDELHYKLVNTSSYTRTVTVKVAFKCESMGLGSVSYEDMIGVKTMTVGPGETKVGERGNSKYVQTGCKSKTVGRTIESWSVE